MTTLLIFVFNLYSHKYDDGHFMNRVPMEKILFGSWDEKARYRKTYREDYERYYSSFYYNPRMAYRCIHRMDILTPAKCSY